MGRARRPLPWLRVPLRSQGPQGPSSSGPLRSLFSASGPALFFSKVWGRAAPSTPGVAQGRKRTAWAGGSRFRPEGAFVLLSGGSAVPGSTGLLLSWMALLLVRGNWSRRLISCCGPSPSSVLPTGPRLRGLPGSSPDLPALLGGGGWVAAGLTAREVLGVEGREKSGGSPGSRGDGARCSVARRDSCERTSSSRDVDLRMRPSSWAKRSSRSEAALRCRVRSSSEAAFCWNRRRRSATLPRGDRSSSCEVSGVPHAAPPSDLGCSNERALRRGTQGRRGAGGESLRSRLRRRSSKNCNLSRMRELARTSRGERPSADRRPEASLSGVWGRDSTVPASDGPDDLGFFPRFSSAMVSSGSEGS